MAISWWKRFRIRLPFLFNVRLYIDETVIGLSAIMIAYRWELGVGRVVGLFTLTSCHEFSHMIVGLLHGYQPRVVRLGLIDGYCVFRQRVRHLSVLFAGLVADSFLLGVALAVERVIGPFESQFALGLYQALVYINIVLIITNFLPFDRSDGHLALSTFLTRRGKE